MDLYRVNYQYVSPQGQIRAASIVVESAESDKAMQDAVKLIPASHKWAKVTNVTLYQLQEQQTTKGKK